VFSHCFGHELDAPVLDGTIAGSASGPGGHEPLVGQVGLDHHAAAVTARHFQAVLLDLLQQAERLQVRHDTRARREALQAAVGRRRILVQLGAMVNRLMRGSSWRLPTS
jgi:hypothetical protein